MILLASLIADAWSTHYLLSRGGREGNPVSRWMLERWGFWPWTAAKMAVGVGVVILAPVWIELVFAALFFTLSARNILIARNL